MLELFDGIHIVRAADATDALRQLATAGIDPRKPRIAELDTEPGVDDRIALFRRGCAAVFGPSVPLALRLAHARSIVARARAAEPEAIEVGSVRIRRDRREAEIGGAVIRLSETPYRLLTLLASRPGRVVPFHVLASELPRSADESRTGCLRAHLSHLRRRLGPDGPAIQAEAGQGYRLVA